MSCAGAPAPRSLTTVQVETLSQAQEELVDWAVVQLAGEGGECPRSRLAVKDFTSQVS